MSPVLLDAEHIVKAAVDTIRFVHLEIAGDLSWEPVGSLKPKRDLDTNKLSLSIDDGAEITGKSQLHRRLGVRKGQINYLGEESLGRDKNAETIDLSKERRLVVLVDMIDGTDLLERGLSNWCSAMIFFDPQSKPGNRIIAAFVGIPEDGVYYAIRERKHQVYKHHFHAPKGTPKDVLISCGLSTVRRIADASICFYGQKIKNLIWIADRKSNFVRRLRKIQKQQDLRTRLYNLAGMPMMIKMIDSGAGLRHIDAVFDTEGQKPHDMVAGAYIATAGGAVLSDLNGNSIDLEESLLRPANPKYELRYILACTEPLRLELQDALSQKK